VFIVHSVLLGQKFSQDWASQKKIIETKISAPIKIRLQKNYKPQGRQIVQSEDGESKTDRPMDDAYLSDKNRTFDRETQSRNVGTFNKGSQGSKKGSSSKNIQLSDLSTFKKGHDPMKVAAKAYSQRKKSEKSASENDRRVSSSSDHLLNVPAGDFTYLNTAEYKYYGFYFRIRQKLEQFWGRSIQEKAELLVKEGRAIASDDEHITALVIKLSVEGEIEEIMVKGTSGVQELDDAAIESFNEAGPFPNPPKDLVVNGQVTIEWGFVVKT
jgi:protein TonB